jgi:5-methylcytosine-specific restriction endonuclease McrA
MSRSTVTVSKCDVQESRNDAKYFADTVYKNTGCRCEICNFYCPLTGEIHHIVPVKSGGSGYPENLVHLCPNCHRLVEKLKSLNRIPFYENPHIDDWLCDNYTDEQIGRIRSLVYEKHWSRQQ